jgi:hypothetical protein
METQPIESTEPVANATVTTLLGTISYEKREDYEEFLKALSIEHSAVVLISAANFAQSKGIFSLDEAELIANAIKRLTTKPEEPIQFDLDENQKD